MGTVLADDEFDFEALMELSRGDDLTVPFLTIDSSWVSTVKMASTDSPCNV